jgi:hypothetical protein
MFILVPLSFIFNFIPFIFIAYIIYCFFNNTDSDSKLDDILNERIKARNNNNK